MSQIEGETTGLLKDVIMSQAVELEKEHGRKGPQGLPPISSRSSGDHGIIC